MGIIHRRWRFNLRRDYIKKHPERKPWEHDEPIQEAEWNQFLQKYDSEEARVNLLSFTFYSINSIIKALITNMHVNFFQVISERNTRNANQMETHHRTDSGGIKSAQKLWDPATDVIQIVQGILSYE
jgi:hypothetical protein